jgi:hypothetical protein
VRAVLVPELQQIHMKNYVKFALVAAVGAGLQSLPAAEVSGKITLKGTPPAEKEITPIKADVNCGKLHDKPVFTRHYVVGADSGLGNVFVYIKSGLEGKKFDAPATPAVIDQAGCLYQPYVIGLMIGQTLDIKNSDGFMHNVNYSASTTGPAGNTPFNIAQPKQGQVDKKTFAKPEIFAKFACNVHPWMFGYLGIVDHPFFAVTDKDGKFSLPSTLPAGKYTLVAKHLKAGEVTQEIEVKEGDKKQVSFTLEAK